MKKWHLYSLAVVIVILSFIFLQDFLARVAWKKFNNPKLAVFLVRSDEKLAMDLGNYYFNGGAYDLNLAEKSFKKAVKIDIKVSFGHYQLARVHFMRSEFDKALKEIDEAMKVNPGNVKSFYVRGLIYNYRDKPGDLALAEEDFKRFTVWVPKDWGGYNDLAHVLSRQKKYKEARDTIIKAIDMVPDGEKNPWLWNSLGVAQLNLQEYEKSAQSFEKAKKLVEDISIAAWIIAYPGNNPVDANSGIQAFRSAIENNLMQADARGK